MIKPINITPLNTSNVLEYECEKCGARGIFRLKSSIINLDNNGNPLSPLDDYKCPGCKEKLVDKTKSRKIN